MGFQGWLGKTVVDSNLLPYKISIHMAMALLIVLFLVYLLSREQKNRQELTYVKQFQGLALVAILLSLIQIGMGTQVRQFVDEQMHSFNLIQASEWLAKAPIIFYVHRSFSILILLVHKFAERTSSSISFCVNTCIPPELFLILFLFSLLQILS